MPTGVLVGPLEAGQSDEATADRVSGNDVRWCPPDEAINGSTVVVSGRVNHVLTGRTLREGLAAVVPVVFDQEFVLGNPFPTLRALAEDSCV